MTETLPSGYLFTGKCWSRGLLLEELVFLYQSCTGAAETYEMETFANNGASLLQDYHVAYIVWYLKKQQQQQQQQQ